MHAVFLSEPVIITPPPIQKPIDICILSSFEQAHHNVHFDILPSCPCCLERLDSSLSGLQQVPHLSAVAPTTEIDEAWPDLNCQICNMTADPVCQTPNCTFKENLWACLVCGFIGCGRYYSRHAVAHSQLSKH